MQCLKKNCDGHYQPVCDKCEFTGWIDVKDEPPRKDITIVVQCEFDIPTVVRWLEKGTYGESGFFEGNDKYEVRKKDILYWMPLPELPK